MEELIDALPGPASMRARLFAALGQDDDGSSVSTARFRIPETLAAPADPGHQATAKKSRRHHPVKISLAEDPVESYLASRKPTTHAPKSEGMNWVQILKWVGLTFLVLQLFWWLAPVLAGWQTKS